ncbi:hypothetical protein OQA88_12464 [Cercophora sp. LCS_1]
MASMNPATPYQYPRLPEDRDHFRLISITPHNDAQAAGCIYGKMHVTAVDNCGDYDALSYCWSGHTLSSNSSTETQAEPHRVMIETPDGTGILGCISITPSLGMALRYLRLRIPHRPIFIDQICINQEDTEERSKQVALMGQIYGKCASVVGWLGPATKHSRSLMKFASRLSRNAVLSRIFAQSREYGLAVRDALELTGRPVHVADTEMRKDRNQLAKLLYREGSALPLDGVLDIFSRLWFRRMWIIQEACLPGRLTFVCGRYSWDMDDLERMHYLLDCQSHSGADRLSVNGISARDIMSFLDHVLPVRSALRTATRGFTLPQLVTTFNAMSPATAKVAVDTKFRATDPRDCIYGLLGLAGQDTGVVPSYTKSPRDVFTEFAVIAAAEDPDFLLYAQPSRKILQGLPSWVPDWSSDLVLPTSYTAAGAPFFRAGYEEPRRAPFLSIAAGNILAVSGLRVDRIDCVGTAFLDPFIGDPDDALFPAVSDLAGILAFCNEVRSFLEMAARVPNSPTPMSEEALWVLCTGGLGLISSLEASIMGTHVATSNTFWVPPDGISFLGFLFVNMIEACQAKTDENGPRPAAINSQISILLDSLHKHDGRVGFVTPEGYVGLGPREMQPGDEVVVLRGSSAPLVLRPGKQGKGYECVGEAYCHGIMYGEALKGKGEDDWITFWIG